MPSTSGPPTLSAATADRPPTLDAPAVDRLESYIAGFRHVFHRADQFLRFRAYLRGLLEAGERRNVESIAAAASAAMTVEVDLAQALQHFVSQSPWDAGRLLGAVRQKSAPLRGDADAVWVVHDGVFPKKGRHSVGVQRQFARTLGRKVNCQMAVVVSQVGPLGCYPLAMRLYLPAYWLRENADTAEKSIPEEHRQPATKVAIALQLLDELRTELRHPPMIVGEEGYAGAHPFIDGLAERELRPVSRVNGFVGEACQHFDHLRQTLGLDHFEGRSWHGWHHHVALVMAAYHFVVTDKLAVAEAESSVPG